MATAGGYTYSNTFEGGDSFGLKGGSNPFPSGYYVTFHTHTLIPFDAGDPNLNFSLPGQVAGALDSGDLTAGNRAAYGNQYVGAMQRTGKDANGSLTSVPVIHFNNGRNMNTPLVSPGKCGCGQ